MKRKSLPLEGSRAATLGGALIRVPAGGVLPSGVCRIRNAFFVCLILGQGCSKDTQQLTYRHCPIAMENIPLYLPALCDQDRGAGMHVEPYLKCSAGLETEPL